MKHTTVTIRLYDSLGHLVTSYATKLDPDYYDDLKLLAEETDRGLIVVKDCEVDGELGWREYTL